MEPLEAEELAKKIVSLGMTVKDAAATKKPKSTQTQIKPKNRDLLNIEEELSEVFGHKIQIEQKSSSKGRLFISYTSKDDREAIISKLLKLKNN
jgi:ParB-like chromosome segregation protein Spo0J